MMPPIDLNLLHHTPAKYAPVKRTTKSRPPSNQSLTVTWLDHMMRILRRPLNGTIAGS